MARAIILLMDSFGIGGAPDAAKYDNEGANTLLHTAQAADGLQIPNLLALGLAEAAENACGQKIPLPPFSADNPFRRLPVIRWGHAREISADKDTVSGHWELSGLPNLKGWGHFPPEYPSFPADMVSAILQEAGLPGILGNKAASGTVIIQELGEEHLATGKPIFYTSADSNLQIAAHEEKFGLDPLYALCEIAYRHVRPYHIGRIIARPFIGCRSGEFTRTANRRDFTALPWGETMLDKLKKAGVGVTGIGAINDIFAHRGITREVHAAGLPDLWDATLKEISSAADNSLIFTNFEDFDMLYGHRRNPQGYAEALTYFDSRLPEILPLLQKEDLVIITADHGNDPAWTGTDHTREQVPVLIFSPNPGLRGGSLGQRQTFADIGQSVMKYFNLPPLECGESFL